MRKNELVYYYALDRKWMSTEQATMLLSGQKKTAFSVWQMGFSTPRFDINEITIPVGFKPTSSIFERNDPSGELIGRIAQAQGIEETAVVSGMNRIIKEGFDGNLLPAAALVFLAKKYHVPFKDQRDALAGTVKKS